MPGSPKHIALIMDGNGRWAEKQGSEDRIDGHERGAKVLCDIVEEAKALGVEYLTFYTFSTENWSRPEKEVDFILADLLPRYLEQKMDFMVKEQVRFKALGDIQALPDHTQELIKRVEDATVEFSEIHANLALNYSGRSEILNAVKDIAAKASEDPSVIDSLDEDKFRNYLYDPELPDPDLLIRTSGELRVSNFLLWQLAYTEIYITDVLWPDFTKEEFRQAVGEFGKRDRRYGGV